MPPDGMQNFPPPTTPFPPTRSQLLTASYAIPSLHLPHASRSHLSVLDCRLEKETGPLMNVNYCTLNGSELMLGVGVGGLGLFQHL